MRTAPTSRTIDSSFGKMPTTSARRLTSLFSPSREFLEPGPQLIGDVPPDLARDLAVGLDESLADGGGDNRLLRLWHVGQRIAHEVHATALPCRADDPLDGGLQPFVRVRDHKLDAAQAASGQALQEVRPEGLGFRRAR